MPRFTIRKRFTFEAAHMLPHHQGKCARMHGHSWVGWVELAGDEVQQQGPSSGMLVDFGDIATQLEPMVEQHLDHYVLNESLDMESPTSEAVAQWVYRYLRAGGMPLTAVTIEETCTSVCTYRE